ncbi:MAG: YjgP/YjgQ family permease [Bacteroidales bacterium]|jgi:lipopolysaccharide export system permease protein|nr:YjgP/YjgQ family permease [Bacteroidales bacterium]
MKKLHKFVLKSYAGPLAMTFFISVFILVMQGLWRYADDIVGKGLDVSVMVELLFYVALQVVPMALPLAILLAALMTFGNLGENYELTAIKASGVSLFRIMRPLIILTLFTSGVAFWFSNNVLPVANLKFYTLLYSVRQARPELEIKERIYYDGVDGFRIKVNHKDKNTGMLYDLIIHDHRDRINKNINVTMADSGRMDIDEKAGVIKLTIYSGITYDEKVALGNKRMSDAARNMYRHDEFDVEVVQVKVDGLDFSMTDESTFKTNDRMKDLTQLFHDADSLQHRTDSIAGSIHEQTSTYHLNKVRYRYKTDSLYAQAIDTLDVINVDSVALSLTDKQLHEVMDNALRQAKSNKQYVDERLTQYNMEHTKLNRHQMEQHRKFTMPIACLLFFFIGAPLGAIIRKGGLGMPVVISVLFFIFYYVIDTLGAKMARESVWPVPCGMWLSTVVLTFIGAFLTYKSATDSAIFKSEAYGKVAEKIVRYAQPLIKLLLKRFKMRSRTFEAIINNLETKHKERIEKRLNKRNQQQDI